MATLCDLPREGRERERLVRFLDAEKLRFGERVRGRTIPVGLCRALFIWFPEIGSHLLEAFSKYSTVFLVARLGPFRSRSTMTVPGSRHAG